MPIELYGWSVSDPMPMLHSVWDDVTLIIWASAAYGIACLALYILRHI